MTVARARAREFNNRHIDLSWATHQYIIYSLTLNVGFLIHGVVAWAPRRHASAPRPRAKWGAVGEGQGTALNLPERQ